MFLIFESILLKFWLQNRYKSGILKLKNRFYSCFGYKILLLFLKIRGLGRNTHIKKTTFCLENIIKTIN